jgi:hypothetical protein
MVETQHVRASLDLLSTQLLDLTTALNSLHYLSGAKVGADLAFLISATSSGRLATNTIAKPARAMGRYAFSVLNPSSVTDMRFDLFEVSSAFGGADRLVYLTAFESTKAFCAGPTTWDAAGHLVEHRLFAGGDLRIVGHNITGSTEYGPTGSTSFSARVRLTELL